MYPPTQGNQLYPKEWMYRQLPQQQTLPPGAQQQQQLHHQHETQPSSQQHTLLNYPRDRLSSAPSSLYLKPQRTASELQRCQSVNSPSPQSYLNNNDHSVIDYNHAYAGINKPYAENPPASWHTSSSSMYHSVSHNSPPPPWYQTQVGPQSVDPG